MGGRRTHVIGNVYTISIHNPQDRVRRAYCLATMRAHYVLAASSGTFSGPALSEQSLSKCTIEPVLAKDLRLGEPVTRQMEWDAPQEERQSSGMTVRVLLATTSYRIEAEFKGVSGGTEQHTRAVIT